MKLGPQTDKKKHHYVNNTWQQSHDGKIWHHNYLSGFSKKKNGPKCYVSMYFISKSLKTKIENKIVNKIKNREHNSYCIFSNYILFLSPNCYSENCWHQYKSWALKVSGQCCISYRNQSFDMHSKSND